MAGSTEPRRSPESPEGVIASLPGTAVVTRVRRIFYVFGDDVDDDYGPVELAFSDGSAVVFDAGADGEALAVARGEWRDPFAGPQPEENRAFVRDHGKWTAFDVSADPGPARLVGQAITGYDALRTDGGKLVGVTLHAPGVRLTIETRADELYAGFEAAHPAP